MKTRFFLFSILLALAGSTAWGDTVALSLSSGDDLNNIGLGDTVTIKVLAEYSGSIPVTALTATVRSNQTNLMDIPTNVVEGPALVAADFAAITGLTSAKGTYTNDPFASNASVVFFTFDVQASSDTTGVGNFFIEFAFADGPEDPIDIEYDSTLNYQVVDVVPTPSSLTALIGMGLIGMITAMRSRRKRT